MSNVGRAGRRQQPVVGAVDEQQRRANRVGVRKGRHGHVRVLGFPEGALLRLQAKRMLSGVSAE